MTLENRLAPLVNPIQREIVAEARAGSIYDKVYADLVEREEREWERQALRTWADKLTDEMLQKDDLVFQKAERKARVDSQIEAIERLIEQDLVLYKEPELVQVQRVPRAEVVVKPTKKSALSRFARRAGQLAAAVVLAVPLTSLTPNTHKAPIYHAPIVQMAGVTATASPAAYADYMRSHPEELVNQLRAGVCNTFPVAKGNTYLTSWKGRREFLVDSIAPDGTKHKKRIVDNHRGVDYDAERGDTVVAPCSGTVTKVSYQRGRNGQYIEGYNEKGFQFYIRHVTALPNITVGTHLTEGMPIAVVASKRLTSFDPHVHWEVIAQDRLFEQMKGEKLNGNCFYAPAITAAVDTNMARRVRVGEEVPSHFRIAGLTARRQNRDVRVLDYMHSACEAQTLRIAYGNIRQAFANTE
jgi:murein DD-endopeptidase MepM/ murein hydrolase activator NlpD